MSNLPFLAPRSTTKASSVTAALRTVLSVILLSAAVLCRANPSDGKVAAGDASINSSPGATTITQLSDKAIINWKSFSIGAGETTKFIQPSSTSAILNRVLGGQMSVIDGTLSANGQVYLLNGNGVLIGPGGAVNTASFVASTRNLSDADFLNGNLHFSGTGDAGVANAGKINALGGDAILIGHTVDNSGEINAVSGHVGLAAADDVMITQSGLDHIFVRSTGRSDTPTASNVGVNNRGLIVSASAELKAANGNIYALATNNSGIIRATGTAHENGRILLIADKNLGVTKNTGTLTARGSAEQGGFIETSGQRVIANGKIDAGPKGSWLIDPSDITIDAPTAATIGTALDAGSTVTEDSSLGTGGSGDITVSAPITWTGAGSLFLSAYRNIDIGSSITGANGTLKIQSGTGGTGTASASAGINVLNFELAGGAWSQNSETLPGNVLPAFSATDFKVTGGSFLRVAGGSGTSVDPYQLNDVFGLQGVGSGASLLSASWRVSSGISAAGTSAWNAGAGFTPIAGFTGTFNGNGSAISGLTINTPAANDVGLFGQVGSAGRISNVILTNASVTGLTNVGGLVGNNAGAVSTSSVSGTVSGTNSSSSVNIGGLTGVNSGAVGSSFVSTTVTGYGNTGGLVGNNTGSITSSYSTGNTASFGSPSLAGSNLGGLVGLNTGGAIVLSYTTGNTTAADSANVGGLVGQSTGGAALIQEGQSRGSVVLGYSQVGGLVGKNAASSSIIGGKLIDGGTNASVTGTIDVGGLVGNNAASISQSSVRIVGSIKGADSSTAATNIGGLVGTNSGTLGTSFANVLVGQASGTTDAQFVGGFAGTNASTGTLTSVYASGNVSGNQDVGGLVGQNAGALGVQSNATGTVTGTTRVGGLIGTNTGAVGSLSYATGTVSGTNDIGGLIGSNNTSSAIANVYANGNVSGTSFVGGLVGANAAGNFSLSNATGAVNGTTSSIGGLMGQNAGTITVTYALGNVSAAGASSVGGLVGDNSGTILSGAGGQSYASGSVTGSTAVGGLAGTNSGTIGDPLSYVSPLDGYTHATGSVTGASWVGGLVGDNAGVVRQSWASGSVNGSSNSSFALGGLAGRVESTGSITVSYSNSTVQGNGTGATSSTATDTQVGGLVGLNLGAISQSNATGSVVGDNETGGLVGTNNGSSAIVQTSYSTGNVTGRTSTGGLVGHLQQGTVTQNYSTSVVAGTASVGGLIGLNDATVTENYATGTVTGATNVGGLIGQISSGGTLTQSYATGVVTGSSLSGGLVGLNSGTISSSFWDTESTNMGAAGIGNDITNTGATGLTSSGGSPTAFTSTSYTGFGATSGISGGASNALKFTDTTPKTAWFMLEGATRPFLAWEAPINNLQSGGAYLVYTAHQLQLISVSLGSSYILGKNVDLSETEQASSLWRTPTGFAPIGTASTPFSGTFSGGGNGLSNLFINTPAAAAVGLFGASSGSLNGVSLSGNVTGGNQVGLLVGLNSGQVSSSRISGTVTGTSNVGGLAGENTDTIGSAAVNVAVTGNSSAGGLAGYNHGGTIQDSYSLGSVTGSGTSQTALGGLAGLNSGTVTIAYSTGAVTGNAASSNVGGSVGRTTGSVDQTYATGAVNGGTQVGGLVGSVANGATVLQSYATGAVSGSSLVGGLAGSLEAGGSVTHSYASGAVVGTNASTTGGLLGQVAAGGTASDLFWDSTKASGAIGTGSGSSITDLHGKSIDANTSLYSGYDTSGSPAFTTGFGTSALIYGSADSVWRIKSGSEFPFLTQLSTQVSGTAYTTEAHTTAAPGATITFNSGTNLLGSTTSDGSAAFAFLFAADDGLFNYLPRTNGTLRLNDSAHDADSVAAKLYSGNSVPDLLANLTQANTWGDTVRVVSAGLNNSLLNQAGSSFISNPGGNAFGGTNVAVSENFDVGNVAGSYSVSGDITAHGDISFDATGQVPTTFSHPVVLNAVGTVSNPTPTFTLNAGLDSSAADRAVVVETDGKFVNNDGLNAFTTPNGTFIVYSQNPEGSTPSLQDQNGGINQLHLYGTNYTQTPTYLLNPGANYQIYTFTPTLTLTAVASGADSGGALSLQYGTPTPSLTYTVSGLLSGDTVTSGATFNQVLSNQPGQQTGYAKYSGIGDYPVTFTTSTLPTSLIGYNLAFAPGNIHVTQNSSAVNLTVSGNQYFGYLGGGPNFSFSASGLVAGDPNFLPAFTTSLGQYANVNHDGGGAVIPYANTISLKTSSVSNYSNVSIVTIDDGFTVRPAALTISGSGGSIYGETIATPTITSNSAAGSGLIYDNSGTGATVAISGLGYTSSPTVTTASHVGNYSFTVAGAAGNVSTGALANYDVSIVAGNYEITPRQLVINGTQNENKVYDGLATPTTFGSTDYGIGSVGTGTGLVNGDVVTGLMGRANASTPNVGHYNYTAGTLSTADSGNNPSSDYTLVFNNQGYGLDITARPITIGVLQNETKVYGSGDPSTNLFSGGVFDITSGSLASGESFAGSGQLSRQSGENVNGGTPYLFTAAGTLGVVNSSAASTTSNYSITFANPSGYGLTITPAPLTVTAKNATKTYNAVAYAGGNGATYSGLKFSDNAASLGGALTYTGTSQGAVNAGAYVITPGGYSSGNYTISYVDGALTINKAGLTVTADNQNKTYGALDPTLTYTTSGTLYGSDDYSVVSGVGLSTTTGSAATAGTHTITTTGGTASNYSITDVNGTLTVAKAPLTVTADDESKSYGQADPSLTYTASGALYYSDAYSAISGVGLSTTTGAAATAGTHTITATGGTASNYAITDVNGTLTVAKAAAPLTVTADDKTANYGTTPTLTYTPTGTLFYGDSYALIGGVSLSTTTGSSAVVGSYAINATGGSAANYNVSDVNGTLTVNKAPLTVTATAASKTYNSVAYSGGNGVSYSTFAYSDNAASLGGALTYSGTSQGAVNAGSYLITPGGYSSPNYTFTYVNGTLTVSKAPLTVTADAQSKIYGGIDPTLTYTPSGTLYGSDGYSVISGVGLSTTTGSAATAGTHTITATGGSATNYSISRVNGTLTVGKAPLTVTADDKTAIYGTTPTLSYTASGPLYYSDAYSVISGVGLSTTTGAAAVVGSYAINATGGTASNYSITDANGTLTVNKAPLTVTAANASKSYNAVAYSGGNGVAYSTFAYSDTIASLGGALTYSGTSQGAVNAGSYAIAPGGYSSNNYTISYVNGSLTINKVGLTVTADNQSKTYGGADPTLTYTASGTLYGSDNYGVITGVSLATTIGSAATAGTHAITATGGTSTNYTITDANGTLTVAKAPLTVTAGDQSKTYGGTDPTLTYTPSGTLYYSDAYSVISGVGLSTTTGSSATAGTHTITATGGAASNYSISDVNGTLTVAKAPLTVTADSKTTNYGTSPTLTYTPSGTLYYGNTYSVISGVGLSTTTGSSAVVGSYAINATGGAAANYAITEVDGTLTVNPATLTITANNDSKTYNSLAYSGGNGVGYNGFKYTDNVASLGGALSYAGTAQGAVNAGSYVITPGGFTSSNYTFAYVNGALTVNKAGLTVTGDNQSKTYGAVDPTLTYTASGTLYGSDDYGVISGVNLATTTGSAATAGAHPITVTGGTATNYTITDGNGILTVAKAPLTVTADDKGKTYGGVDPILTYTANGPLYYSDNYGAISGVSLSGPTGATATAGTHTISATGGSAANYAITDADGTLTVSKAPLTITADNQSKNYGGLDPTLTYTPTGTLYYGDNYGVVTGVSLSSATMAAATAGTHAITITGGTAANYAITDVDGLLTVGKASLTVSADNQSKVYGATDPLLTYTPTGTLYYGDNYSSISGVSLSTTTGAAATAGSHPITASGGSAANYTVADVNGTLAVSQAPLTITADNQTKTYGAVDPTLTYSASGTLYYGDNYGVISGVSLSAPTGAAATAGTHTIAATGGTAGNYAITNVDGTLTINKAPLAFTADDKSKTYGAVDPTLTYTPSGTLYYGDTYSVISGVSLATTTGAAASAGMHTITATGGTAANYALTGVNGTLTVGQAALTVTANDQAKIYGASDPTLTYTSNGTLYYGDNYNVISGVNLATVTGSAATAGIHTITTTGGAATNYAITNVNGTLNVDKAALTITANDFSKTYNAIGYNGGNGVTYAGFKYTDGASSLGGGLSYTGSSQGAVNAGHYVITPGGYASANYTVSYLDGALTVNQAPLTITADSLSKTYGAADPVLTFTPSGTLYGSDTYAAVTGVNLITSTGAAATAGTHPITVTGGIATNYSITPIDGTLTVNKAPLTVTADNQTKTYGAIDPTLSYTPSGTLYYGDNYSVIGSVGLSTSTGAAATAGVHAITATGGSAANYVLSHVDGTLMVNKAALTVTADNQTKIYGDSDPALTYTPTGTFYYGDNEQVIRGVNLSTATGSQATAGAHTIEVIGGVADNYTIADVNGTLTVDKAPLTIAALSTTKLSGASLTFNGNEFKTTGLVAGDKVARVGLVSSGAPASAVPGSYAITVTAGSAEGSGLGNYNISYLDANLTVLATNLSQLPLSRTQRFSLDQVIGAMFLPSYGEKWSYGEEVPGTFRRVTPHFDDAIDTASSLVDTSIGLDPLYDLDRFQTYRH